MTSPGSTSDSQPGSPAASLVHRAARAGLALGLGAAVAGAGWQRGALTPDGAIAATFVGASTFGAGGPAAAAALIAFFVSGSALSRRARVPGEVESAKGHRRDSLQVLANGGFAALTALISGARPGAARGAMIGALAAAAADTWASEIGVRSSTPPRSILSGRPVRPGTSGGVTGLGWLAAGVGATLTGTVFAAFDRTGRGRRDAIGRALVGGLVGTLADSIAGATIQAGYACAVCGVPAEAPGAHCGRPRIQVRGHQWVTNDVVNGIGTASGALVGALLAW